MKRQVTRADMAGLKIETLHEGRWGNADVLKCDRDGHLLVIKDFAGCPFLFRLAIAPALIRRELNALSALAGLDGIPRGSFRLDRHALGYEYIPGRKISTARGDGLGGDFFIALESLVRAMHGRNIAHLDLRRGSNILVRSDGRPALLDFQSSVRLDKAPARLRGLLRDVDLSGVYKNWLKLAPESLDESRRGLLDALNRKRRFWILKGYPFG